MTRKCASCKRSIEGRRADALTCSAGCRKAHNRHKATKRGRRVERERVARERRAEVAARGPGSLRVELADIRGLVPTIIEGGSIDLVLTDPPYPREYLDCWRWLSDFAALALKPGGMLVALSGGAWLPEVFGAVLSNPKIEYRWTAALCLPGASTGIIARRVNTQWKPAIVATRAGGKPAYVGSDLIRAPARRDQADLFHGWGQSPGAMDALAARFVERGTTVADPFAGGGELALAAQLAGAAVIATDSDPDCIETMRLTVTESVTPT